jgi:glutaredoxin 3
MIDKGPKRTHLMSMASILIYTKAFCPYCTRAKRLLDGKGAAYEEIDISMGGPKRQEMLAKSNGRTTVPQIFIGDTHVGGSDDLAALERDGRLDALLTA